MTLRDRRAGAHPGRAIAGSERALDRRHVCSAFTHPERANERSHWTGDGGGRSRPLLAACDASTRLFACRLSTDARAPRTVRPRAHGVAFPVPQDAIAWTYVRSPSSDRQPDSYSVPRTVPFVDWGSIVHCTISHYPLDG